MSYVEIEKTLQKPYITDEELCNVCKSSRGIADMKLQCNECNAPLDWNHQPQKGSFDLSQVKLTQN